MVDTATFQRLRGLKQLGLAHLVYPNATHTRFAHSLGTLAIMSRVTDVAREKLKLSLRQEQDLRLAALLHDIGHYPYSHLMERAHNVVLTEERLAGSKQTLSLAGYPHHQEIGRLIVTTQEDLIHAIGGKNRAGRVAKLFTRDDAADPQLSKLIHSSLDMDRFDYLVRDARAAGVPYGEVDFAYLLHNLQVSPTGMIGVSEKCLAAADQFLLARFFMHRAVYYHKTIFGLEEAFKQLVRRCIDNKLYKIVADRNGVESMVGEQKSLLGFTDRYLDDIAHQAMSNKDDNAIRRLAEAIIFRRPPKLLKEVCVLVNHSDEQHTKHNACTTFLDQCKNHLSDLAKQHNMQIERFLIAEPKSIQFEERGSHLSVRDAKKEPSEERDELLKVFIGNEEEPRSLVDIPNSLIYHLGNLVCRIVRLYVLEDDTAKVRKLNREVNQW